MTPERMFYIILPRTMKLADRLLALLRMQPSPPAGYFELDEPLQAALAERADREQRPLEQIQAELLEAGLDLLQTSDGLKHCWETLSRREKEVTALTCLGYTNRQMAAHLNLSPATVKDYMRQALVKWNAHGKDELRILLVHWDFSSWGALAQIQASAPPRGSPGPITGTKAT